MRVLFTGASSFTGVWFVSELMASGHEVTVTYTAANADCYTGMRRRRLDFLRGNVRPEYGVTFGDEKFIKLLQDGRYDVICHHAADATDHKSPAFDAYAAVARNTHNIGKVIDTALEKGVRALVATGTYFEADEGMGTEPRRAFSPYGLSKTLTWQVLRYHAETKGLALAKFVLPNPVGLMDEVRFVRYMLDTWRSGKPVVLRTPHYVRDNAPVRLLAVRYANFANETTVSGLSGVASPSGWASSVLDFTHRAAKCIRDLSGLPCEVRAEMAAGLVEPLVRTNRESILSIVEDFDEKVFWGELWNERG